MFKFPTHSDNPLNPGTRRQCHEEVSIQYQGEVVAGVDSTMLVEPEIGEEDGSYSGSEQ